MSDPHAAPPDDEPRSPMWLPALGAALFVGLAVWWAVTPSAALPAPEGYPVASIVLNPTPPPAAPPAAGALAPAVPGSARQLNLPAPGQADLQQRLQNVHNAVAPAGGGARR
jgi:hypothetical protein